MALGGILIIGILVFLLRCACDDANRRTLCKRHQYPKPVKSINPILARRILCRWHKLEVIQIASYGVEPVTLHVIRSGQFDHGGWGKGMIKKLVCYDAGLDSRSYPHLLGLSREKSLTEFSVVGKPA